MCCEDFCPLLYQMECGTNLKFCSITYLGNCCNGSFYLLTGTLDLFIYLKFISFLDQSHHLHLSNAWLGSKEQKEYQE